MRRKILMAFVAAGLARSALAGSTTGTLHVSARVVRSARIPIATRAWPDPRAAAPVRVANLPLAASATRIVLAEGGEPLHVVVTPARARRLSGAASFRAGADATP